jgi:hypothetical protein
MASEIPEGVDLFGNPVRPGHGQKGRPPYEATDKDRNKVKLLLALGWANTKVANAVDISLATLKRHFRAELKVRDQMRDRLDAWRIEKAVALAEAGNVAALKEVGKIIERSDLMGAGRRIDQAQEADAKAASSKKTKLGKKASAALDAVDAGKDTGWGEDLIFPGLKN